MSDQIPYIESDDYVAYNNEKGGVIERLKADGIIDLDTELYSVPEWISTKAMLSSWLADAITYELWVGSDGSSTEKIYCSDLPWPIGKVLFLKQRRRVKQQLGITKDNAEQKGEEVSSFLVVHLSSPSPPLPFLFYVSGRTSICSYIFFCSSNKCYTVTH